LWYSQTIYFWKSWFALLNLPSYPNKIENVEANREECMVVLRSSKPPKKNLSKDERKYL